MSSLHAIWPLPALLLLRTDQPRPPSRPSDARILLPEFQARHDQSLDPTDHQQPGLRRQKKRVRPQRQETVFAARPAVGQAVVVDVGACEAPHEGRQ